MKHQYVYRIPDQLDKGHHSREDYLLINCLGYEYDEPAGLANREQGRVDFLLSYLHRGTMKVKIANQEQIISAGTVFIGKPYERQYYAKIGEEPTESYWLHFTGYGVTELLIKAKLWGDSFFVTGINDDIPRLFERIIEEEAERQINFEHISASLLQELIFTISRNISIKEQIKDMNPRELDLHTSFNLLHKNYAKKLTVTELAAHIGLSTSRYTSVFKQYTGLSPQQYLIQYRLQKAKELINNTQLNIRQIAALVGFDDQMYFSRLFKKYEHMSPIEFRKKSQL
ncbi:AraC family transcriptional regulator [Paenibacillus eucommiae]|uniref:AraC-like DNA-binding protein n=1 Tax=Paenibacillus eucommiae TaxID=1355755 RepID=A0ABS4IQS8_9BACL|nr:AraC family transcriptional regulator [Paenibacillus eucommiae]MBP1989928.1 AraC-like DNA-binding protein [Paenibacillus eucommiae]